MNIFEIYDIFEHRVSGPLTEEIIQKLQQWRVIAPNGSMQCAQGHTLQLKECEHFTDNFAWKCHKRFRNDSKKKMERCNVRISIRKGTFFEKSHLSLFQVVCFAYLWLENCSLKFICKQVKISKKTAVDWASFHREVVIAAMTAQKQKIGGVDKIVEVDESKFGRRKYHRGHAVEGQWVFGGVERGSGRCFMVPVESRNKEVLLSIIKEWISPGTTIISDCWKAYDCLSEEGYQHLTVNHSMQFKNPENDAHTNNVEGMWRHVKASLPVYSRRKHFFTGYLAKFMFVKKCKSEDLELLEEFFRYAGEVYNPLGNEDDSSSDSASNFSDDDII